MTNPLCVAAMLIMACPLATAALTISDNTISWPDDGWYQVQKSDTYEVVCEGTTSCEVSPGEFIVTNHSTGERFEKVFVGLTNDSNSPVQVSGSVISWPDDGWYQVQRADTYESVCNGGSSCSVPNGVYNVRNHSTGEYYPNVLVDHNPNDNKLRDFEIVGSGDNGNRGELAFLLPLNLHIKNARELEDLYNVLLIDSSCPECNILPERPVVDFEKSTLVFIATDLGQPVASFSVERAVEGVDSLLVDVETTAFGNNCVVLTVSSAKYHFYKVDGTHNNVEFNDIFRVRDC